MLRIRPLGANINQTAKTVGRVVEDRIQQRKDYNEKAQFSGMASRFDRRHVHFNDKDNEDNVKGSGQRG